MQLPHVILYSACLFPLLEFDVRVDPYRGCYIARSNPLPPASSLHSALPIMSNQSFCHASTLSSTSHVNNFKFKTCAAPRSTTIHFSVHEREKKNRPQFLYFIYMRHNTYSELQCTCMSQCENTLSHWNKAELKTSVRNDRIVLNGSYLYTMLSSLHPTPPVLLPPLLPALLCRVLM